MGHNEDSNLENDGYDSHFDDDVDDSHFDDDDDANSDNEEDNYERFNGKLLHIGMQCPHVIFAYIFMLAF